jgi:hypothetical protein
MSDKLTAEMNGRCGTYVRTEQKLWRWHVVEQDGVNYLERLKRRSFQENLLRLQYSLSDDVTGLFGTVYQSCEKCDLQTNPYRPTAGKV